MAGLLVVVKYAILIPLFAGLYMWKGTAVMLWTLGALALFGIAVHFWMRWMTDGWRKSWGPYKPFDTI